MRVSKLAPMFAMLALGVANAADTYKVSLHETTMVAGKQIKPGDYKIEVNGGMAVIKDGKTNVAESPVKVETGSEKFQITRVRYENGDGKYHLQEIRVGGTNTRLVFAEQGGRGTTSVSGR